MKKVLILANKDITLLYFRKELIEALIQEKDEVILSFPESEKVEYFKELGCEFIDSQVDRRGMSIIKDLKLLFTYLKIMKKVKPDVILTFTIKPNIYGGIMARLLKIKAIHTVTGLGSVYIRNLWAKNIIALLNRIAFKNSEEIFFLNNDNKEFYINNKIIKNESTTIIAGSGVNLEKFKYVPLKNKDEIIFTFIGRIFKDKGIEEYIEAAKNLKQKYKNIQFQIVGGYEEDKYKTIIDQLQKDNIVKYLGEVDDVRPIIEESTCIVLPSYGEGRGTVLQEGAAIGRSLIGCNTYGIKETIEEGKNGFLCQVKDSNSLQQAMEKMYSLPFKEKEKMGAYSRKKAEKEFNRKDIIKTYKEKINKIGGKVK